MTDASPGFTIVRTFDAPPEEIWAAWTEPDRAAQWWHPRATSTPRESVAIDVRVGGRYTYTMVDDATGQRVVTRGIFREVVPFERLVFTWGEPDGTFSWGEVDGVPVATPVVTVTLEPVGDGTRMTFDLRGVAGTPGDGSFHDGWAEVLDALGEYLGSNRTGR